MPVTHGKECSLKIKTIENHQLPSDQSYLLTYREIKDAFAGIDRISLWKSNHPFRFDRMNNTAAPVLTGTVILTLSVGKRAGNVFLQMYGCDIDILNRMNASRFWDDVVPQLTRWLADALALWEKMPMHRELVLEVSDDSGDLKIHRIEGA